MVVTLAPDLSEVPGTEPSRHRPELLRPGSLPKLNKLRAKLRLRQDRTTRVKVIYLKKHLFLSEYENIINLSILIIQLNLKLLPRLIRNPSTVYKVLWVNVNSFEFGHNNYSE
jgi:hypothetical protein